MGPKGQGYRWHSHGADVDVMRFSIAPPPPLGPVAADDFSDEESQAATNDEAPDVQPMDPDVRFPLMQAPMFIRSTLWRLYATSQLETAWLRGLHSAENLSQPAMGATDIRLASCMLQRQIPEGLLHSCFRAAQLWVHT